MTSFSIHNFGCRVNQAEAFSWSDDFQKGGLRFEVDPARSDLVIVNSCTLTGRADRDVRKFVRRIARENPGAKLVVTGCYAERAYEEFRMMPQVWMVLKNSEKKDLAGNILRALGGRGADGPAPASGPAGSARTGTSAASAGGHPPGGPVPRFPRAAGSGTEHFRSRAIIKVQDGCDFRCAFCIIPSVRGKSASRPRAAVLSEAREYARRGFHEIVLAGIHLCSYGLDFEPPQSLTGLLRDLEEINGGPRIRLSSLDPRFLDDAFIAFLTAGRTICPHFHLSLQSGSDRVLRAMGRPANRARFQRILAGLRSGSPEAGLGADIIVGFPGESDAEFASTYDFLAGSPLTYFHVFSFSPRTGTAAADMEPVGEKTKKARSAALRKLSREKNLRFRRSLVGKDLDGIVIQKSDGVARILTSNYIDVRVPRCGPQEREAVRLRISEAEPGRTEGTIIDGSPGPSLSAFPAGGGG